jgi:hypothetical protein
MAYDVQLADDAVVASARDQRPEKRQCLANELLGGRGSEVDPVGEWVSAADRLRSNWGTALEHVASVVTSTEATSNN